jgi:hypothetical protein
VQFLKVVLQRTGGAQGKGRMALFALDFCVTDFLSSDHVFHHHIFVIYL